MRKITSCFVIFFIIIQASNAQRFSPPSTLEPQQEQNDTINRHNEHGERTGFWRGLFRNGNPRYEGNFKDGKPTGKFTYYFPEGGVRAELIHIESEDELEFDHVLDLEHEHTELVQATFYHRGTEIVMAKGQYANRKKQGLWRFFNERGNLAMKNYYHEDEMHGVFKTFFNSGNIMEIVTYHYGEKKGKWEQYYENGNIRLSANYNNDMLNGEYEVFYENGSKRIKGYYYDNLLHKTWTHFAKNGEVEKRIVYEKGQIIKEDIFIEPEDFDKPPIRPGNDPYEDIFEGFF